jgi:hypothetical protein
MLLFTLQLPVSQLVDCLLLLLLRLLQHAQTGVKGSQLFLELRHTLFHQGACRGELLDSFRQYL